MEFNPFPSTFSSSHFHTKQYPPPQHPKTIARQCFWAYLRFANKRMKLALGTRHLRVFDPKQKFKFLQPLGFEGFLIKTARICFYVHPPLPYPKNDK